jgi:hypothetical protein
MAGYAADFRKAIDNLLGYPPHNLTLFDAGESLPQVIKAMKSGATFCDCSARVTFYLYQCRFRTLTRRGESCHNTSCASTCNYYIEFPYRQLFCGFFVDITKLNLNLSHINCRAATQSTNSKQYTVFMKISTIHSFLLSESHREGHELNHRRTNFGNVGFTSLSR